MSYQHTPLYQLRHSRPLCGLALFLASTTVYATLPPAPELQSQGFQLNFYGGLAVVNNSFGPEYYTPNPLNLPPNTLSGPTDSAEFAPGLGISYVIPTKSLTSIGNSYLVHDLTLGIKGYYLGASPTGTVYAFGNPSISSDSYTMNLNSWRVMFDSELDFHPALNGWLVPFFEAGIGDAINTMKYNETATVSGAYALNLQTNTKNNLAYDLGFGVKIPASDRSSFSFSYLYSNLGEAEAMTSAASSTKNISAPLTANMHASSFLVGFNYGLSGTS